MKVYTWMDRPKHEGKAFGEKGRTEQHHKRDADINHIVAKAAKTGIWPQKVQPDVFADVSEVGDFQSALAIVSNATNLFESLPAIVRDRFRNNPADFVAFATDPQNGPELVKLGLAKLRPKETPPEAPQAPKKAKKEAPPTTEE